MRELCAPEIKFCRRPTALANFLRERREGGRTGCELFSYLRGEYSAEPVLIWSRNGNGKAIKKSETSVHKFKPLRTIEDVLSAKGITELVLPGGFTYDLTNPTMNATEEDIIARGIEERNRVKNYIENQIPLTGAMKIFAKRKRLLI